ncbi:uncharacterized protein [Miscanthus floridulus]|uniref:uncharacterized protein n=1 Tax=Miscanthus floridulus TaxID=154761 RepID=UPI00345A71D7
MAKQVQQLKFVQFEDWFLPRRDERALEGFYTPLQEDFYNAYLNSAPEAPDATWLAIDCSIHSLIYSSSSPRVKRLIMESGASAHTIWTKAANLFLDNKASRAMTLEAKFCSLSQGDLLVLEYAQRLKDLADGLADLDQPVSDPTLLLALLRGINKPLRGMASILKMKTPLPSFLEA